MAHQYTPIGVEFGQFMRWGFDGTEEAPQNSKPTVGSQIKKHEQMKP